jgi:hypothetical protein
MSLTPCLLIGKYPDPPTIWYKNIKRGREKRQDDVENKLVVVLLLLMVSLVGGGVHGGGGVEVVSAVACDCGTVGVDKG